MTQPFESVCVTLKVSVDVGATEGFEDEELKAVGEPVQEYVLFDTAVAPIPIADDPAQKTWLEITAAAGRGLTVIITEFDLTQPFESVCVTV